MTPKSSIFIWLGLAQTETRTWPLIALSWVLVLVKHLTSANVYPSSYLCRYSKAKHVYYYFFQVSTLFFPLILLPILIKLWFFALIARF